MSWETREGERDTHSPPLVFPLCNAAFPVCCLVGIEDEKETSLAHTDALTVSTHICGTLLFKTIVTLICHNCGTFVCSSCCTSSCCKYGCDHVDDAAGTSEFAMSAMKKAFLFYVRVKLPRQTKTRWNLRIKDGEREENEAAHTSLSIYMN